MDLFKHSADCGIFSKVREWSTFLRFILGLVFVFDWILPPVAADDDVECEYSYVDIFNRKSTIKFECHKWDYCCADQCCRGTSSFYRLWYFWLVVILVIFMCIISSYLWRRRILLRRSQQAVVTATYVPAETGHTVIYPGAPQQNFPAPYTTIYRDGVAVVNYPPAPPTQFVAPHPAATAPQSAQYTAPPPAYNELYK